MKEMEQAIQESIERPECVMESFSDPYYGTLVGDKYLCVVVKVQVADAYVLTAYLTDKIKRGVQLWPKKT